MKGAEQTVVVSDAAALLNTMNAQLQNSVEAQKIVDLPLSGNSLKSGRNVPRDRAGDTQQPVFGTGKF